jgi:flagellar basal-body rod protein FlgF
MTTGIWSATSGAVARTMDLDVAANNIANATTPGFRADRAVFVQRLIGARAGVPSLATRAQRYAVIRSVQPNLDGGNLVRTGRSLDVALRQKTAFFAVSTPAGERYTRAGNMELGPDGLLVTHEGHAYLDGSHRPVRVPADANHVGIGEDGQILADGDPAGGQLLVVEFNNPGALRKDGDVLLQANEASGRPSKVDPELEVETLEQSNASALRTMTTLVNTTREFEMITKVIDAFSSMEQQAASQVMKGK